MKKREIDWDAEAWWHNRPVPIYDKDGLGERIIALQDVPELSDEGLSKNPMTLEPLP